MFGRQTLTIQITADNEDGPTNEQAADVLDGIAELLRYQGMPSRGEWHTAIGEPKPGEEPLVKLTPGTGILRVAYTGTADEVTTA